MVLIILHGTESLKKHQMLKNINQCLRPWCTNGCNAWMDESVDSGIIRGSVQ